MMACTRNIRMTVNKSSNKQWTAVTKCYIFNLKSTVWWLVASWLLDFCSIANKIRKNVFCWYGQNINLDSKLMLVKLNHCKWLLNVLFSMFFWITGHKRGVHAPQMLFLVLTGYSHQDPGFASRLQLSRPALSLPDTHQLFCSHLQDFGMILDWITPLHLLQCHCAPEKWCLTHSSYQQLSSSPTAVPRMSHMRHMGSSTQQPNPRTGAGEVVAEQEGNWRHMQAPEIRWSLWS